MLSIVRLQIIYKYKKECNDFLGDYWSFRFSPLSWCTIWYIRKRLHYVPGGTQVQSWFWTNYIIHWSHSFHTCKIQVWITTVEGCCEDEIKVSFMEMQMPKNDSLSCLYSSRPSSEIFQIIEKAENMNQIMKADIVPGLWLLFHLTEYPGSILLQWGVLEMMELTKL